MRLSITILVVLCLGFAASAQAGVIYDYDVTGCTLGSGQPCNGLVGTTFATFSPQTTTETNFFQVDNNPAQPHFVDGTADFSLTVQNLSLNDGTTCAGCTWSVDIINGLPDTIDVSDLASEEYRYRSGVWNYTDGGDGSYQVTGNWALVSASSSTPVSEPGSFEMILTAIGILLGTWVLRHAR